MSVGSIEASNQRSAAFERTPERGGYDKAAYAFTGLLIVYVIVRGVRGAAARPLYCDEILTLSIASQSSLHNMWRAMTSGYDTQGPVLYLLERAMLKLPMSREIAMRLPAIAALACTAACIFAYVKKRSGELAACLCAILLLATNLFDRYLLEARGYSMMVGCIALALVCYQRLPSWRWAALLGVSLFLAEAFHYYAVFAMVPFGLAEVAVLVRTRRVRWPVWIALACGTLPLFVFWRALSVVRAYLGAHVYSSPVLARVPEFYGQFFLVPDVFGVGIAAASIVAIIATQFGALAQGAVSRNQDSEEIPEGVLLLSLSGLPLIAFVIVRVMHGALLDRYVLTMGLGVVLGLGCMLALLPRRATAFFALVVLSVVGVREMRFWHHAGGDPRLHDLSVRSWDDFGQIEEFVQRNGPQDLPVVFAQGTIYTQVVYYCPPQWTKRLVYLIDEQRELKYLGSDSEAKVAEAFAEFFPLQLADYSKFATEHSQFLMYGEPSEWALHALLDEGNSVQVLKVDGVRWLYLVKMKNGAAGRRG